MGPMEVRVDGECASQSENSSSSSRIHWKEESVVVRVLLDGLGDLGVSK